MTKPANNARRKAAIAVVALGPERGAEVLRRMDRDGVTALVREIEMLGPVSSAEVAAVVDEIRGGLPSAMELPAPDRSFTRELVSLAVGDDEGARVLAAVDQPAPFRWLDGADVEVVAPVLAKESPSAIALALAHVEPSTAAAFLLQFGDDLRDDVAHRIASLYQVLPDTIAEVDRSLKVRLHEVMTTRVERISGTQRLADVLQQTDPASERAVLQSLSRSAPDLADATREALFTFEDAMGLDARSMQVLLKGVETRDLATALVSSDTETRDRVLANMSERARANLSEEIDLLGKATKAEMNAARKAVVAAARRLEEEGSLELRVRDAS